MARSWPTGTAARDTCTHQDVWVRARSLLQTGRGNGTGNRSAEINHFSFLFAKVDVKVHCDKVQRTVRVSRLHVQHLMQFTWWGNCKILLTFICEATLIL